MICSAKGWCTLNALFRIVWFDFVIIISNYSLGRATSFRLLTIHGFYDLFRTLDFIRKKRLSLICFSNNFGGTPFDQGAKSLRINQRPISALISSRHVAPKKDGFPILTSSSSGAPSSSRIIVFHSRWKIRSRSPASSFRPYPAPLFSGVPLRQS